MRYTCWALPEAITYPKGLTENGCAIDTSYKILFPKALGPSVSPGSWPVFIWSNESLGPPACLPVMEQEEEEGLQEVPDVTGLRVSALLLPAMAEP